MLATYPNYGLFNAKTESDMWTFKTTIQKDYAALFRKPFIDSLIKRVVIFENKTYYNEQENETHGIIILHKPCYRRELPDFLDRRRCVLFWSKTNNPIEYFCSIYNNHKTRMVFDSHYVLKNLQK